MLLSWWVVAAGMARISEVRLSPRRGGSAERLRRAGAFWFSLATAGELLVPAPGRRDGGGVQELGFCPPTSSPLRRRARRLCEVCEVGSRSFASFIAYAGRGGGRMGELLGCGEGGETQSVASLQQGLGGRMESGFALLLRLRRRIMAELRSERHWVVSRPMCSIGDGPGVFAGLYTAHKAADLRGCPLGFWARGWRSAILPAACGAGISRSASDGVHKDFQGLQCIFIFCRGLCAKLLGRVFLWVVLDVFLRVLYFVLYQ